MGNSLQEQLLKAGLIDQKRIEQAEQEKRKKARQPKPGKKAAKARPAKPAPTPEQLEKAEKDRELARQRREVQRQREVAAEVRQLVRSHRVARTPADDDIPYNFENKGKIKRLYLAPALHRKVSKGELVIVNDNGVFELVAPAIAEKIRQRNPSLVIDLPEDKAPDANDPYAGYEVPDDLMW